MTTPTAENLYLAQHLHQVEGKKYAIFNPNNKNISELPFIYGFNNGGKKGWYEAVLISQDGECLGGHICSHEGYMEHDLGILEGSRNDRHEEFKKHYPDGYRMNFIGFDDVRNHEGLQEAIEIYAERNKHE